MHRLDERPGNLALRLREASFRTVYDPAPALVHRKVPMGGLRMSDQANGLRKQCFSIRTGRKSLAPSCAGRASP